MPNGYRGFFECDVLRVCGGLDLQAEWERLLEDSSSIFSGTERSNSARSKTVSVAFSSKRFDLRLRDLIFINRLVLGP